MLTIIYNLHTEISGSETLKSKKFLIIMKMVIIDVLKAIKSLTF